MQTKWLWLTYVHMLRYYKMGPVTILRISRKTRFVEQWWRESKLNVEDRNFTMKQLESYGGRLKGMNIKNRWILKTSRMWKRVPLPITWQELFAQCLGEMKYRCRVSKFGKIVTGLIHICLVETENIWFMQIDEIKKGWRMSRFNSESSV